MTSESCCKYCRINLNEASIIPCVGNLICSKCLHSKDANEELERNSTLTSSFSTLDHRNVPHSNNHNLNNHNGGKNTKSFDTIRSTNSTLNRRDSGNHQNTNRVIEAINQAAEEKIREIEIIRQKLIDQVKMDARLEASGVMTPAFTNIYDSVQIPNPDIISAVSTLVRPTKGPENSAIRFNPAKEPFKAVELGCIEYDDELFKIEARNKIALLNNDFQYKIIDLSPLIKPVTINKRIQLLAPDKVLLIHEKAVGRVNDQFL